MADEQAVQQVNDTPQPAGTGQQPEAARTFTQDELDAIITKRLADERERMQRKLSEEYGDLNELRAAREKLREREEAEMSELDKLRKQLEEVQRDAETKAQQARQAELTALRLRIGQEVGVPASLAQRLTGDDEDAIRADAEAILQSIGGAGRATLPATDATAGGSARTGASRRLTPTQRSAAQRAGISEEDYAAALDKLEK